MRVPREVLECVAFIYAKFPRMKEPKPLGTVFFIKWHDLEKPTLEWSYAVTARHVIDDIKEQSTDDIVYLRLSLKDGHGVRLIRTKAKDWFSHPTNASVDVAVLPWELPYKEYQIRAFTLDGSAVPYGIPVGRGDSATLGLTPLMPPEIGDEVFMAGLFTDRVGEGKNVPILRIGNLAAIAGEPIDTKRFGKVVVHLIEARSIGGLSGSPVFVNLGPHPGDGDRSTFWSLSLDSIANPRVFALLGLIHGHWDEKDRFLKEVNMGIAMVVPTKNILEVLRQPKLEEQRTLDKEESMAKKNLPTMDSAQIARNVVEAAIGEPLASPKKSKKTTRKAKKNGPK